MTGFPFHMPWKQRLNWTQHIQNKVARAKRLLNSLLRITRGNWGPRPTITRWIYTGIVRPSFSYAAIIWAHATKMKTTQGALRGLDRAALNAITYCKRSTPTRGLSVVHGLLPFHLHLTEKALQTLVRNNELAHMPWSGYSPLPHTSDLPPT